MWTTVPVDAVERALAMLTPRGWAHCLAPIGDDFEALFPEEQEAVGHCVEQRRRDFATGRLCARQALQTLGATRAPIMIGPDRAPVWPEGFVASLSHSAGLCAAVAAPARSARAIGLDVEWVPGVDATLLDTIATPGEISTHRSEMTLSTLAACLFSTKEAVFKAYNPVTAAFLQFLDIGVALDVGRCAFRAELTNPSLPRLFGARRIDGRFAVAGGYVIALASV
jgi:4'-phosphopantetheinyl transferase EntD